MMRSKVLIFTTLFTLIALGAAVLWSLWRSGQSPIVGSFDECVARGYPILESYPPQCRTPDGRSFTQDIGNELEKISLIRLEHPRPNEVVASPLRISGQARGPWFFEADFPARLLDGKGNQLGVIPVQAQGEWMTERFVPFQATLTFQQPDTVTGTLLLEKANPSGLPQQADQLRVPVRFSP